MSKQDNNSGEQDVAVINPTPHHWPADKPAKKIIRNDSGESQDEDRHNEIRHEDRQKTEGEF